MCPEDFPSPTELSLDNLRTDHPAMIEGVCEDYINRTLACMRECSYGKGVGFCLLEADAMADGGEFRLNEKNDSPCCTLTWGKAPSDDDLKKLKDSNRNTEFGAVAIALLLVAARKNLVAKHETKQEEGFDYYLQPLASHESASSGRPLNFLNGLTKLEVSGILNPVPNNNMHTRMREKLRNYTPESLPIIVVVQFRSPNAYMVTPNGTS